MCMHVYEYVCVYVYEYEHLLRKHFTHTHTG